LSDGGYILIDDYLYLEPVRRAVDTWVEKNKEQIQMTKGYHNLRGDVLIKLR
jgi:hypothetical protein